MLTAVLLSVLLGSVPENASEPSLPPEALAAPPVADESPTSWSCTVDTLRAGKECVFEAELTPTEPNREQEASNLRLVRELVRPLCTETVRSSAKGGTPDKTLMAQCERLFTAATERCGLEGTVSLVDTKGRFAPAARACYRALSQVLQEVHMMATVASSCCQCAAQRGCPGAGERCYAELSHQEPGPATLTCMRDRCADACFLTKPAASSRGDTATPSRGATRASRGSGSL